MVHKPLQDIRYIFTTVFLFKRFQAYAVPIMANEYVAKYIAIITNVRVWLCGEVQCVFEAAPF